MKERTLISLFVVNLIVLGIVLSIYSTFYLYLWQDSRHNLGEINPSSWTLNGQKSQEVTPTQIPSDSLMPSLPLEKIQMTTERANKRRGSRNSYEQSQDENANLNLVDTFIQENSQPIDQITNLTNSTIEQNKSSQTLLPPSILSFQSAIASVSEDIPFTTNSTVEKSLYGVMSSSSPESLYMTSFYGDGPLKYLRNTMPKRKYQVYLRIPKNATINSARFEVKAE